MRVVNDTHVFVGACIGVGASNAVVRACLQHRRLKALAKSRGTPLNPPIDDMTTEMLAEFVHIIGTLMATSNSPTPL